MKNNILELSSNEEHEKMRDSIIYMKPSIDPEPSKISELKELYENELMALNEEQ